MGDLIIPKLIPQKTAVKQKPQNNKAKQEKIMRMLMEALTTIRMLGNSEEGEDDHFIIYALSAHLNNSPLTNRWMATVDRYMASVGPEAGKIERVFRGVVKTFEEYNIRFWKAPYPPAKKVKITKHLQEPNQLMHSRRGDCRENSLLIAATLSHPPHNFKMVFIRTIRHIVPAVISEGPKDGKISGIPFVLSDKKVYLYPIEPNLDLMKYNFEQAINDGQNFVKNALQYNGQMVLDTNGNIYIL